jgi:hypothetical protein
MSWVIKDLQPTYAEASPGFVQVHLHGFRVNTDHAEHVVSIDDLVRSRRISIEFALSHGRPEL